jgi:hypothetical protein
METLMFKVQMFLLLQAWKGSTKRNVECPGACSLGKQWDNYDNLYITDLRHFYHTE